MAKNKNKENQETTEALQLAKSAGETAQNSVEAMTEAVNDKSADSGDFCPSEKIKVIRQCNIERDHCGLIKGLEYEFDSLGFVNYKKLIPREFLYPNKQYFQKRKLAVPNSIDDLSDSQLICALNGYRLLGAIRGFKSIKHKIISESYDKVVIETKIIWIGNYETGFKDVAYTALSTASLSNTFDFAQNYLAEIAQNRGECRAIRGFLRIPIVASDELGPPQKEDEEKDSQKAKFAPAGPHAILQKKLNEKNTSWDKFKESCIKKNIPGSDTWTDLASLETTQVVTLVDLMNKKEEEKNPQKKLPIDN